MSRLHPVDDAFLNRIVALHTQDQTGAPYWVRHARERSQARTGQRWSFEEFRGQLGFRNRDDQTAYEQALRELPIEEFIPRPTLRDARWLWASETGGTTGIAKRGTWGDRYWDDILAFSDEFLDLHEVPRGENWIFIGPTGPHTTGRLLISIVEHRGGRIFCIDMDPRIVRTYLREGDSEAVDQYVRHIWEQVDPILRYQNVGVMFCTATLLDMMPRFLPRPLLKSLKAVVHAGLAMSRDTHRHLREELFPGRPVVGIYGTSVSGISFQKPFEAQDDYRIIYIPSQPHIVLECIDEKGNVVAAGTEGDVRCFRFTDDQLIPGFIERDRATRVPAYGRYGGRYPWDWLGDPHSPASLSGQRMEGVY